jgi:hypothetical protein
VAEALLYAPQPTEDIRCHDSNAGSCCDSSKRLLRTGFAVRKGKPANSDMEGTKNVLRDHVEKRTEENTIHQGKNLIALLSVQVNEPPAPASGACRIKKVMGDSRALDRMAPGPSGEILPARASCFIALGILYEHSVDAICPAPRRRRRPSEGVGGGNKTDLARPRGDRSLSERHEASRHIGRVDRIQRRREQFNRHGKSVCQLSIYRQFRADLKNTAVL